MTNQKSIEQKRSESKRNRANQRLAERVGELKAKINRNEQQQGRR